jgi:hypothetical protein
MASLSLSARVPVYACVRVWNPWLEETKLVVQSKKKRESHPGPS